MTTHDTTADTSCLCTDCAREIRKEPPPSGALLAFQLGDSDMNIIGPFNAIEYAEAPS